MTDNRKEQADARTDAALAASGLTDPRPTLRERMRFLREEAPQAYETAREYYDTSLVPQLAEAGKDPLLMWIEYGIRLGELSGPGKVVTIDATGRARPVRGVPPLDQLIIHVPNDPATAALPLAVPHTLSSAQKATLELLVHRARALS
jgi:hypothetical protein